ncbi:hypothetical protein PANT_9d00081 [Moesziomyces antarcticus T-34]|uniref:NADH dehydrogenase [ubiquinone] 1 beta subcomplex subunit 11, mitochondrial n=1 Tax=Pseudozyma antarctica (strain T-34) TaxID=1151754 RepID=M9MCA9_PSEA3|nr:hypothetical protein PANT_9d00081 [Moesziomyces antarcticus T-34]
MPEPSHPMATEYFRQNFSSSLTSSLLYTNFSDEKSRTRPGRGSARAVAALTVTCVFASPLAPPLHHRLHPVSRTYTMFRQALSTSARPDARCAALQRGTAAQARFASGGSSYNQPTGYLFGEKVPKGQKRQKENWENMWYFGMFGGMAFAAVALMYKPDTSIQTWAMAEAKKRLEASGDEWQYKPSPNSGHPNGV